MVVCRNYWLSDVFIGFHNKRGASGLKNLMMDGFKDYEGKKVFIKLKNGRSYSGEVLEVEDKGSCALIVIKDKFGKRVTFYDTEISVIEEESKK